MGHPMCCWYYRIFYEKICPVQNLYTICFTFANNSAVSRKIPENTNNALEPVPVRVIRNGLLSFKYMEAITMIKRQYIDINEVIESYLPMSKKKARKFVIRYLDHKRIGNKIYVDRIKLEELLKREDVESFPLD